MNGKEVFKFAVRAVPQVVEGALQEAGLTGENIDWLLLHQVLLLPRRTTSKSAKHCICLLNQFGYTV